MKRLDTIPLQYNTYEYEDMCPKCRKNTAVLTWVYEANNSYATHDDDIKRGMRTGVMWCKKCCDEYQLDVKLISYGH